MHTLIKNNDLVEASLFTSINTLKRVNITIHGNRTSVTLEPKTWDVFKKLATANAMDVHELSTFIYDRKNEGASLSSAIRVFLISYLDIVAHKEA